MKEFKITDYTALYSPCENGMIKIGVFTYEHGWKYDLVPFEELEKWVASIKDQIITSSNDQAKDCGINKSCRWKNYPDFNKKCRYKPPVG